MTLPNSTPLPTSALSRLATRAAVRLAKWLRISSPSTPLVPYTVTIELTPEQRAELETDPAAMVLLEAPRQVKAPTPGDAAEAGVSEAAGDLQAGGKHRNRLYVARVWPGHGQDPTPCEKTTRWHVSVSLLIRTATVERIGEGA